MEISEEIRVDLFEYLLRLGDDRLILGHRLSQWCGHGPFLEEDIALANIALDCLGHASHLLKLAGDVENKGNDEDQLAYFREAIDYRNLMLVEQPIGDFAFTIARQFLFDVYSYYLYQKLQESKYELLAAIAAKTIKEVQYHLRHSREWILRLGDGTNESHKRLKDALEELWTYTDEMFNSDDIEQRLVALEIVPDATQIKPLWQKMVREVFVEATLEMPDSDRYMTNGSREGIHSEHLGYILAEMQILARSYPGAKW